MRAFITGLAGASLTTAERQFVQDAVPWGLILFKRNVTTPDALRRLIGEFRAAVGRQAPILVDQEGGRVQRLGPPQWPAYPPGAAYGAVFERDPDAGLRAARLGARLIANDLAELGIDVDCAPVADVPAAGADPVIGDRAYGADPAKVAALAGAFADGLTEGGVLPVLKHLPGHGRATADSHKRLPVVTADQATLDATDFAAFRPLCGLPLGMTAHVVFTAVDPVAPATTSANIVKHVIRDSIGFTGLLMSDDISMGALSGSLSERTRAAIAAGCDVVLHCNGALSEMVEVASEAPVLAGNAAHRAAAALAARKPSASFDVAASRAELAQLLNNIRPEAGFA
ncbi:MAG: beta-N-acetylhexosaminidase [Rhizobiales bacterium]|nr:beta-N-acetylhexosaminidase [Hyphomicrobiales bacterium]